MSSAGKPRAYDAFSAAYGADPSGQIIRPPMAPVTLNDIGEGNFPLKTIVKLGDTAQSRQDGADMIAQNEKLEAIQVQGLDAWNRIKVGKEQPGDAVTLSMMVNNGLDGGAPEGDWQKMNNFLKQQRVVRKLGAMGR